MYTKKRYPFIGLLRWTRYEILLFLILATIPVALIKLAGLEWLRLPFGPLAMIGTVVAFLIGFQNNAAYGRIWEARKIWGGIVNTSRSWGMIVQDQVTNEHCEQPLSDDELANIKQELIYRHLAWLTALRFAMRTNKPWEVANEHRSNRDWNDKFYIPERESLLNDELKPLLPEHEYQQVLGKTNSSTAILSLQSASLRALKDRGLIWEFSFLEMENVLMEFFNLQGKTERIKNFPYPRQYATLSEYIVRVFILLVPFSIIGQFAEIGDSLTVSWPTVGPLFIWLTIPFSAIIGWVFHTIHRIGTVGENPFEGTPNDVPISTISRGIEIDLREMLNQPSSKFPAPLTETLNIQM